MSTGNGSPRRYVISMSQAQRQQFLTLHEEQHALGRGQRFIDAFREILRRLRNDPSIFGEPLYTLPALSLEIRQAAVHPIVIDYGVHEGQKKVFIRQLRVLS